MRFYTRQHVHYCGIDLHARSPYREDLVVAVECLFCWYWVADLCSEQGIEFVLGHALYMKAIHGGKTKNDRIDSYKIAALLRGRNLPYAYVYPRQMRATHDLLRRRPGIGEILSLTLPYEIHDLSRFPRVQDLISYARLG